MSGTISGGAKTAKKIAELYGKDHYSRIGALGGRAKVPKGFAKNIELARIAGSKGGKISKRVSMANSSTATSRGDDDEQ